MNPRPPYSRADLLRLLHPDSVAIVGASPREGSFGDRALRNLAHYDGRIHLVNARYDTIGERRCYPGISALPEVPDCAVIAVNREGVEPIVQECAQAGVGGAIVFASGYAEVGKPERVATQRHLAAIARETGLRIVGPNCIGVVNYLRRAAATFMAVPEQPHPPAPHAVGVISQSGAMGFALALATEHGSAVSHILTSGNSCDVDMADYVAYLADEPACRAIVCLFEGMAEPARLIAAADIARNAGKPLVVHKIAIGEAGAAAALSHTGSLAGLDAAWRAAFDRAGAIVVDQFEDLMETAAFFAKVGAPQAPGIAVLATSGGAAIMAADKAAIHGVPLPQPAAPTRAVLEQHIPEFGSARNPCDVTAQVLTDPESLTACARALLADEQYAAMLVPQVYAYAPVIRRIPVLSGLGAEAGKFVIYVWVNEGLEGPGAREAEADPRIVLFRSMDRCFRTLALWQARAARQRTPAVRVAPARLAPPGAGEKSARVLERAHAGPLDEHAAKQALAPYGIPLVEERRVASPDDAVAAAHALGFPVVLKLLSPDLPHKTEAGVVRLGLASEAELRAAWDAVTANAAKAGAAVTGAVVQPMVPRGIEVMVGARIDPLFGPLVLIAVGGVLVELLHDTALALAPVSAGEAGDMLRRLQLFPLLAGFRGGAAVDLDRLADVIARISEFAADQAGRFRELDVNPLICAGERIVAVDALIAR
jgi:acyl-CoA synthetase (NDP forming)